MPTATGNSLRGFSRVGIFRNHPANLTKPGKAVNWKLRLR